MTSTDTPPLAPKGGSFLTSPVLIAGVFAWIGLNAAALVLAGGYLPFDRPALASLPFAVQMAFPTVGMIQIFAMMGLVWWLTRRRAPVDMGPERRRKRARRGRWRASSPTPCWVRRAGGS